MIQVQATDTDADVTVLHRVKMRSSRGPTWKLRAAALTPASLVRSAPMASWLDTAPRLNSVAARSNAADDRSLRAHRRHSERSRPS